MGEEKEQFTPIKDSIQLEKKIQNLDSERFHTTTYSIIKIFYRGSMIGYIDLLLSLFGMFFCIEVLF